MTRKHLSTRERVKVFDAAKGVCHLCTLRIQAGEDWDVSHAIPLAAGGADDPSNMLPAHRKCHRQHTARHDAPLIAKTRRQRAGHIGAKAPSRNPIPGSRGTRFRKRMDGTVEARDDG